MIRNLILNLTVPRIPLIREADQILEETGDMQ